MSKNWCFTINNPEDNAVVEGWGVKDATWQLEVGDEETPHLQGVVRFHSNKTLSAVKKLDARAHWEVCRDTTASDKYCSKEEGRVDGPWRIGQISGGAGKRTDIMAIVEAVESGTDYLDIVTQYPQALRYKRNIEETAAAFRVREAKRVNTERLAAAELRPWQESIVEYVTNGDVDPRCIVWVYDTVGNTGKSFMASYLCTLGASVFTPAKKADIAYAYAGEPIVVFDCSRTATEGGIDNMYSLAEEMKNGRIFSAKYTSINKVFNVPHVIVFSNAPPDYTKWSKDRYDVHTIVDGHLQVEAMPAQVPGLVIGFDPIDYANIIV